MKHGFRLVVSRQWNTTRSLYINFVLVGVGMMLSIKKNSQ